MGVTTRYSIQDGESVIEFAVYDDATAYKSLKGLSPEVLTISYTPEVPYIPPVTPVQPRPCSALSGHGVPSPSANSSKRCYNSSRCFIGRGRKPRR